MFERTVGDARRTAAAELRLIAIGGAAALAAPHLTVLAAFIVYHLLECLSRGMSVFNGLRGFSGNAVTPKPG